MKVDFPLKMVPYVPSLAMSTTKGISGEFHPCCLDHGILQASLRCVQLEVTLKAWSCGNPKMILCSGYIKIFMWMERWRFETLKSKYVFQLIKLFPILLLHNVYKSLNIFVKDSISKPLGLQTTNETSRHFFQDMFLVAVLQPRLGMQAAQPETASHTSGPRPWGRF